MPTVAATPAELADEARRLDQLVAGKTVKRTGRHRPGELFIEFVDDTRLFVVAVDKDRLESSVT